MTPSSGDMDESRMPLWEHLHELRKGLVHSLVAFVVGLCITFEFSEPIVRFLEKPLLKILPPAEAQLYFTGIADKFLVYFKVSALAALGLTSPYILYRVWVFVSPALYRNEKKFAVPFIVLGSLSFLLGLSFAYFVVIPYGYKFLIEFGSPSEKAMITLTEYFSLTIKLMLVMGCVFELPVAMILLGKFGIVTPQMLSKYRRHAVVAIAVVSAIVTPTPDALTMILVMGPLYLLYEASIVGVRLVA